MTKKLSMLLVLVMLVAVSASAFAEPVAVKDFAGNELSFDKPVTKVVVLMPSDCEILYAIGAGDIIIGRGTYCDYPEEVKAITEIKTGKDLNIEQIIALQPELIIATKMGHTPEQMEKFTNAGIKVYVSDAQTIDEVYQNIETLGKITGKNEEAKKLVEEMKAKFAEIKEKVAGKEMGTAYYEVSPLQWGLYAAGKGTFMDEIGAMLGLKNVFEDQQGWPQVSPEQVIAKNPDYIFTTTMYFGEGPMPEEEIMGREGWDVINAVKNEKVHAIDNNIFTRPSPRLIDAVQFMYDLVYGVEVVDNAA